MLQHSSFLTLSVLWCAKACEKCGQVDTPWPSFHVSSWIKPCLILFKWVSQTQVSYYRPYYVSGAAEFATSPIARSNLMLSGDECDVVFMILQPVQYIQLSLAWQRKYQTEPIKSNRFKWFKQTTLVFRFHNTMPSIAFSLPNNVFGFMFWQEIEPETIRAGLFHFVPSIWASR